MHQHVICCTLGLTVPNDGRGELRDRSSGDIRAKIVDNIAV